MVIATTLMTPPVLARMVSKKFVKIEEENLEEIPVDL
jgi:hypothetical protein